MELVFVGFLGGGYGRFRRRKFWKEGERAGWGKLWLEVEGVGISVGVGDGEVAGNLDKFIDEGSWF